MANIIYSFKDIFEQELKTSMRGCDEREVDEFLDNIIKDHGSYISQVQELRAEDERLKQQLAVKPKAVPTPPHVGPHTVNVEQQTRVAQSATSIDILKRISRLEKEVFGKQIIE